MALRELLPKHEAAQTQQQHTFADVLFHFSGFQPNIAELDLGAEELQELRETLTRPEHRPQRALVLFDNNQPRLIIVHGERERWLPTPRLGLHDKFLGVVPYLHVLRTDEADDKIFILGRSDYHPFEDRGGYGLDIEYCLPSTLFHRHAGEITVGKEGNSLVISAKEGEVLECV